MGLSRLPKPDSLGSGIPSIIYLLDRYSRLSKSCYFLPVEQIKIISKNSNRLGHFKAIFINSREDNFHKKISI